MTDPRTTSASESGTYAPGSAAPITPQQASIWEDFIDIFYAPSTVLRRRASASPWPPMLVAALLTGIVMFFVAPAIEPALQADFMRALPAMQRQNPNITPEMVERMKGATSVGMRYGSAIFTLLAIALVGAMTWLVGKLVDSAEGYGQATLVAAYAYLPRVLGGILLLVETLVTDVSGAKSAASLSFSAARFLNPDTTSPVMMQVMLHLDVFVIWETVILAIGVAVLGQTTRGRAIAAGVLFWIVGTIPMVLQGLRAG